MGQSRSRRWKHPIRDITLLVVGLFVAAVGSVLVWALTATGGSGEASIQAMRDLVLAYQPGAPLGPPRPAGREPEEPASEVSAWDQLRGAIDSYERAVAGVPSPTTATVGMPMALDFDLLRDAYAQRLGEVAPEGSPARASALADLDAQRDAAQAAMPVLESSSVGAMLDRLIDAPGGARPEYQSPLVNQLLPELGLARRLALYLGARMREASATGDSATVLLCFERCLAIARVLAFQAFPIDRRVAIAVAHIAMEEVRLYAATGSMSADDARAALEIMGTQLAWPGPQLQVEGARLSSLDLLQHSHSAGGLLPGRFLPHSFEKARGSGAGGATLGTLSNVRGLFMPGREATTQAVGDLHDGWLSDLGLNPRQRKEHGFDQPRFLATTRGTDEFIRHVAGLGMQPFFLECDRHESLVGLTRLRLALLIFQQTRGSYPQRLVELAGILPGEPRDPFADDGRFIYRAEETGFVLKSVGWDGLEYQAAGAAERVEVFEDGASGDFVIRAGG